MTPTKDFAPSYYERAQGVNARRLRENESEERE